MTTKIILKKSSVAEKVPLATDLEVGEIAINLADRKLFSKDGAGNIIEFGSLELQQLTVYNGTGSTITKGSVVYINGAQGQKPSIAKANNSAESTSSKTFGFVTADIANGADGIVTTNGLLYNVNTGGLTEGGAIYLGSTAGTFTQTKPVAPNHLVSLGWVVKANASSGRILVHVQNGFELHELHDVLITSPADDQVLTYESATGLWKNKTFTSGGGGATNLDGLSDVTITSPTTGQVLKYNGTTWVNDTDATGSGGSGGATLVVSDTAPSSPTQGTLWFSSANLSLYLYYQDGTSNQWVKIVGSQGPTGPDANISKALAMTYVFN